jgi:hypothetical protein
VLVVVLIFLATRSGAKPTAQAPQPPVVDVAQVEQRDVPVYGDNEHQSLVQLYKALGGGWK